MESKEEKTLDLTQATIDDFSFLVKDVDFQKLILDETRINNESAVIINQLTQLRALSIADTAVTDLSFLSSLKDLEEIDISGTAVSDISIFKKLPKLKRIIAHDTLVDDLQPLASLKYLQELAIERAKIRDIRPLENIRSLEIINLYGNKDINTLPSLDKLEKLKDLCIKGTHIVIPDQLNCLEKLKSLESLTVNNEINFAAKLVLKQVEKNRNMPISTFFVSSEQLAKEDNLTQSKTELSMDNTLLAKKETKVQAIVNSKKFQNELESFLEKNGILLSENLPLLRVLQLTLSAVQNRIDKESWKTSTSMITKIT